MYRKFKNNELWKEKRKFSKAEAWIDLLMRANWKEASCLIGVQKINIEPGQILTSQKKLAAKWQWNIATVHKFLKLLARPEIENIPYIRLETYNKFTLITILKWGSDLTRKKKKKKKKVKTASKSEHEIITEKLKAGIPLQEKRTLSRVELKLIRLMGDKERDKFLKLDEVNQKKHLKKLTEAKKSRNNEN